MSDYTLVIVITFVAFVALAAVLLVPVYRFLRREEEAGRDWTSKHGDGSGRPHGRSGSSNGSEA